MTEDITFEDFNSALAEGGKQLMEDKDGNVDRPERAQEVRGW